MRLGHVSEKNLVGLMKQGLCVVDKIEQLRFCDTMF